MPARFQVWVRRNIRREPLIERKNHPDLIWVPKSRPAEATIWICRRGPDLGNIIEAIGITTPPEDYYGIRCSAEAVAILRSIRWRGVLDPLPSNHAPNMSQADIVRAYAEAAETAQPHDVEDDDRGIGIPDNGDAKPESASHLHRAAVTKPVEKSTRRALTTEGVAEPHRSWEPIGPFVRYGVDVVPDQPASSVVSSTSPQARRSTDVGILSDECFSWWTQRLEQFKRDLRPDGPLIAHLKEEVVDDQRSTYLVELRLAKQPTPTGPHNILFIWACSANESA